MNIKILTVPGYGGSNAEHWQSYWDREFKNIERVEQANWDDPQLEMWADTLNSYIQKTDEKFILVAHSLACSLIAHWASKYESKNIIGALLVSPADVDSKKHTPKEVRNFSLMPTANLPFKTIVVASDNDPYVSIQRAEYFSKAWGSRFINYGSYGHINAETGLKSWGYGKNILRQLI